MLWTQSSSGLVNDSQLSAPLCPLSQGLCFWKGVFGSEEFCYLFLLFMFLKNSFSSIIIIIIIIIPFHLLH